MAETLHSAPLASLAQGGLGRLDARRPAAPARPRADRPGAVRRPAGRGAGICRSAGSGSRRGSRAQQGQTEAALAELSPRRRGAAVGAPGHPGRVPRRPLVLSGDLRSALSRIRRSAAAPRAPSPARCAGAESARRATRSKQLKESELQDYFRDSCVADFEARQQSIDTIAAGHGGALSDLAARPARIAGQLRAGAARSSRSRSPDATLRGEVQQLPRTARKAHDQRIPRRRRASSTTS